ncbi:APH(3')-II family aminoglycoside O-phosphotransferase [Aminobacter sp. AP02]|uniref:APH(3')-II family aminoglycoside O-phosphotransferase n=1 Tax=Aminobacter sp. AP02 TaxID=2135737 RepID=UPI000D6B12AE|nr:APH(3') family aminoglycoside O-phosphotransferase [Aminobacter sp. AP02]PWK63887.1 aminoglycoside 3'-phosphotransferase-2 [Aminobacter sp. AP02]
MTQHSALETDLPASLRGALAGYDWQRQTIGASGAGVFRLEAACKPALFLKCEESGPFAELPDEVARLRWLGAQGIPCPEVIVFETHGGHNWLLMSALGGRDLVSQETAPDKAIAIMAEALRTLHALDISTCPFDHRLAARIALAKTRMEAGIIDEDDFDEEWLGQSAETVFEQVLLRRPTSEELVVTHGDASMPNFIAEGERFTGFIDCSRLGVADRHQDLGIACWSIHLNLGPEWIAPFLALYGLPEADAARLSYYQLLDEFF